jgi:hypothetical protein
MGPEWIIIAMVFGLLGGMIGGMMASGGRVFPKTDFLENVLIFQGAVGCGGF